MSKQIKRKNWDLLEGKIIKRATKGEYTRNANKILGFMSRRMVDRP